MKQQTQLDELLDRLRKARDEFEAELERMLEAKRAQFSYSLARGRVVFDRNIKRLQRRQRIGSLRYIAKAPIAYLLTAPIIYGMVVPILLLDITMSLYQHICFRVYKIPRVVRSEYVVIDRHYLAYLNLIQKLNCVYCSYGNGVLAYAREIVARTEQYWCPIKNARRARGAHERAEKFFDYGDAEAWRNELQTIRCDWDEPEAKEKVK